jgi:hypothetical protein
VLEPLNSFDAQCLLAKCNYELADLYGSRDTSYAHEGLRLYSQLLLQFPDSAEYFICRGHLNKRLKYYKAALQDFENGFRLGANQELLYVILYLLNKSENSDCQSRKEFYIQAFDRSTFDPRRATYYNARSALNCNNIKDALKLLEKVYGKPPIVKPLLSRKISCLKASCNMRLGLLQNAHNHLMPFVSEMKPCILHFQAMLREGESEKLIKEASWLISERAVLTPRLSTLYSLRALAYLRQGSEKEALFDLLCAECSLKLPRRPDLGDFLSPYTLVRALSRLESQQQKTASDRKILGLAHLWRGAFGPAMEHLEKTDAHFECALAAYLGGNASVALWHLDQISTSHIDPELVQLYECKARLSRSDLSAAREKVRVMLTQVRDPALRGQFLQLELALAPKYASLLENSSATFRQITRFVKSLKENAPLYNHVGHIVLKRSLIENYLELFTELADLGLLDKTLSEYIKNLFRTHAPALELATLMEYTTQLMSADAISQLTNFPLHAEQEVAEFDELPVSARQRRFFNYLLKELEHLAILAQDSKNTLLPTLMTSPFFAMQATIRYIKQIQARLVNDCDMAWPANLLTRLLQLDEATLTEESLKRIAPESLSEFQAFLQQYSGLRQISMKRSG